MRWNLQFCTSSASISAIEFLPDIVVDEPYDIPTRPTQRPAFNITADYRVIAVLGLHVGAGFISMAHDYTIEFPELLDFQEARDLLDISRGQEGFESYGRDWQAYHLEFGLSYQQYILSDWYTTIIAGRRFYRLTRHIDDAVEVLSHRYLPEVDPFRGVFELDAYHPSSSTRAWFIQMQIGYHFSDASALGLSLSFTRLEQPFLKGEYEFRNRSNFQRGQLRHQPDISTLGLYYEWSGR